MNITTKVNYGSAITFVVTITYISAGMIEPQLSVCR